MSIYLIRKFIYSLPAGRVFTTRDVLQFAKRATVDVVLFRLVHSGVINRLARGVFVRDPAGNLCFSASLVAAVKAEAFGKIVLPYKGNLAVWHGLVIDETKKTFISVLGRTSRFAVGKLTVDCRGMSAKEARLADSKSGQAIRALLYLGKKKCDRNVLFHATRNWGRTDRQEVPSMARWMPAWLANRLIWK